MSRRGDDSFKRLLRWYPVWWRVANGEVLLGTLRDQAEYENRTGPSRQEVLSAVINGLGMRLDARFALGSSVGAIMLSAASWSLLMFGLSSIPGAGGWIGIITTGVAPALTLAGLIALIRFRGWVGAARALLVLGVLTGVLVLAAFAQLSWAQGFQLADAGLPQSGLAAAWGPLVVAGFILGAAGLGILLDGALRNTRLSWLPRAAISIFLGGVTAPVLGLGLLNPTMSTFIAVVVAIMATASVRTHPAREPRPSAPVTTAEPWRLDRARRVAIQWLGWLTALFGTVGVLYALTGANWSAGATDSTEAMGQGITILFAASIPLLATAGLSTSTRVGGTNVWGPLGVAALAVTSAAVAYTNGPQWEGMAPWMFVSAALGGAAIAWWATPRLRGPFGARIAVGLAIGVAYSALFGIAILPMLAFTVPVLAIVMAARGGRDRPTQHQPLSESAPIQAS